MWRSQSFRIFLGSFFLALSWSACDGGAVDGSNSISQPIQRGEGFLTNLFDTRLQLATKHSGVYATYKLALYPIAADRLNTSPPHANDVIARLLAMQSPEGGW